VAGANQSVTPVPATDANRANMMRSYYWYQPNVTISAVPAGSYDVFLYVFEDNNAVTYPILVEGNVVQADYNSGSAGTWRKLGPFSTTINDGNINVRSTSINANFSGVEIWTAGQGSSSSQRLATGTTISENTESEEFRVSHELAFYPNPFSNNATIAYTASQSGSARLSMYDVRGVKIWSSPDKNVEKGYSGYVELETSNFQDGVYILELINGGDIRRLKVIRVR
jgi:hypothetical protein